MQMNQEGGEGGGKGKGRENEQAEAHFGLPREAAYKRHLLTTPACLPHAPCSTE